MKLTTITAGIGSILLLSLHAHAEDFHIDDWTPEHVRLIPGKNSEGSAVLLSPDNPHEGKQSVKLVYNIQGMGYAEFSFNPRMEKPAIMSQGGPVKVSFWVRGNPETKLKGMNIRLIDAKGEVFQYPLNGIREALLNPDWTQYSTELDLDKSTAHFAGNADGVVDYPVKLLSFCLDSAESDSGSVFIDDLSWEQVSN